jgi:hypothetical protein
MHTQELRDAAKRCEDTIVQAWRRNRWPKRRPLTHYASKAAHPCLFYLWAYRERWEMAPDIDDGLLGIFKHGDEVEHGTITDMREGGFQITKQQVLFEDKKLQVRGRVDGFMRLPGDPLLDRDVPLEIKSMAPSYHGTIHSFQDMLNANMHWLRTYPGQLLLYAVLPGGSFSRPEDNAPHPFVAMAMRNKSTRQTPFLIEEVAQYEDEVKRIKKNLRQVNRHIKDGTEPQPIPYDPVMCDGCDFAAICPTTKALYSEAELVQVEAPEIDALFDEMVAYKQAQLAFQRAERKAKKMLEDLGYWEGEPGKIRTLVTDKFRIECKVITRTGREGEDPRPKIKTTAKALEYVKINP